MNRREFVKNLSLLALAWASRPGFVLAKMPGPEPSTNKPARGGAGALGFVVPSGFPDDAFRVKIESCGRFVVPPKGESTAWAGWVSGKFRRNLDVEDQALDGKVSWLVASDGGFPPGWLDEYERETAATFGSRKVFFPMVKKGK